MINQKIIKKIKYFDWMMLSCILILISLGLLAIFSITSAPEARFSSVFKGQLFYTFIGFLVFFIFSFQDYRIFKKFSKPIYVLMLFLLLFTLFWGRFFHLEVARWINIGSFQFQPSELAKVFLVIFLSGYLSERVNFKKDFKTISIALILVFLPLVLIGIQPDLGTALVFLAIFFIMIFYSPIKRIYLGFLVAGGIFLMPIFWIFLRDYQKMRILTFLNPTSDPLGAGYHILQSIIAVGSGGLLGKGIGQGFQSQLKFLPAPYTDFIFATLAEELGFLGIIFLLGIFFILFLRMIKIAKEAQDWFGRFLVLGAMGIILFQLFVNIGMNIGIMPITGIPLPLVSYGGSSLISTLFLLGIVESVAVYHKKIKF